VQQAPLVEAAFEENLTAAGATALLEQLTRLDVPTAVGHFKAATATAHGHTSADNADRTAGAKLTPAPLTVLSEVEADTAEAWRSAGLDAIAAGKVAVLTMAGGQGSR
jgi:hypothetical protein